MPRTITPTKTTAMKTTPTSNTHAQFRKAKTERVPLTVLRRVALFLLMTISVACSSADSNASESADVVEEPSAETGIDADSDASDVDSSTETSEAEEDPESDDAGEDVEVETVDEPPAATPLCGATEALAGSRADVQQSGNRVAPGSTDFTQLDETIVELPDTGIWVTADPTVTGGWYIVLERGSAVRVSPQGVVTTTLDAGGLPPEFTNEGTLQSPFRWHELFTDPLPDGRVVVLEDIAAVLADPTDIYPHGVLGDEVEAAAIEWIDTCTGESGWIGIGEPDVIEGISPILVDIDRDGQTEIIVTLSNSSDGARLAAFELDGTSAGQSEPIGQGNRWRNVAAVGAFGPGGEVEIIEVQTPHIGGLVQSFRQIEDEELGPTLVQVAESEPRYTSHVIGSRNLSMGIGVDANDDSFPDVLVATANRNAIVALTRTDELDSELQGWEIIGERALDNALTSNIASQEETAGRATIAVVDGNLLRIWR